MSKILIEDSWLSDQLNRPSFALNTNELTTSPSLDGISAHLRELPNNSNAFVFTKVFADQIELVATLTSCGFYVVDTSITFEQDVSKLNPTPIKPLNVEFRQALDSDEESIAKIAKQDFSYSRFHADPILRSYAGQIKEEWTRNFFKGKRGTHLLVAQYDSEIIGFNLIIKKNELAIIDLIAVKSSHHGKGIGTQLILQMPTLIPDISKIRVGTQITNVPSCNLYQRAGLQLSSSQYVLHFHQNQ